LKKKTNIIGTKNLRTEERILIKNIGDNKQCTPKFAQTLLWKVKEEKY
jgi:hypothetical protein